MPINVWAYFSPDFASANVPFCSDGNSATVPLPRGTLRWDRTLAFTAIDELVSGVAGIVAPGSGGHGERIEHLGVMVHGAPGGLRILRGGEVLSQTHLSTYAHHFQTLNGHLNPSNRGPRPVLMFLSCAAAAPPEGTELMCGISMWMPRTRVIGFTTILTSDAITPRELDDGSICLPPDLRGTTQEYHRDRDITQQHGGWTRSEAQNMPVASPRAFNAREFRDGELYWEPDTNDGTGREASLQRPSLNRRTSGRGATEHPV